jgi:hypothetical protein
MIAKVLFARNSVCFGFCLLWLGRSVRLLHGGKQGQAQAAGRHARLRVAGTHWYPMGQGYGILRGAGLFAWP